MIDEKLGLEMDAFMTLEPMKCKDLGGKDVCIALVALHFRVILQLYLCTAHRKSPYSVHVHVHRGRVLCMYGYRGRGI